MNDLDKRYLFTECAPRPQNLYERKLFELLRLSGTSEEAMIEICYIPSQLMFPIQPQGLR